MGKEFTYARVLKTCYDSDLDEIVEDCDTFTYEVNWQECKNAIIDIIFHKYFKRIPMLTDRVEHIDACKKAIGEFIEEQDLNDVLMESMEEDLKDYFEDDAFESLED